ncbi:MAG: ferritin [Candidatus Brocadiia bacterium]
MVSERLVQELNSQVNAELYSAYLYLAMSAYFDAEGMTGFAGWMRAQAQEETFHAYKFYHYLNERGARVRLPAIEEPPGDWSSPLAAFQNVAEHEAKVTALIDGLMDSAVEENDHATQAFLQWFVAEQVEEEATAQDIVQRLQMIGDSGQDMLMLDRELGAREFSLPAGEEEEE